jgi:hypothetical protein
MFHLGSEPTTPRLHALIDMERPKGNTTPSVIKCNIIECQLEMDGCTPIPPLPPAPLIPLFGWHTSLGKKIMQHVALQGRDNITWGEDHAWRGAATWYNLTYEKDRAWRGAAHAPVYYKKKEYIILSGTWWMPTEVDTIISRKIAPRGERSFPDEELASSRQGQLVAHMARLTQ